MPYNSYMITWLLKRTGVLGTIFLMTAGISIASLFATWLLDTTFQLGLGTAGILIGFFLPMVMASPLLYIEITTIAKLESAQKQLESMATMDILTGVPNRAHFFTLAESVMVNAPPAQPVGLAIIDIDRFKLINDVYGHLAGDQALRDIAQTIQTHLRPGDIFGRFGGDEFILLCPNTTQTEILELTHYVLQHVQTLSAGREGTDTRLSATMGVTTAIPTMTTIPQLIAKADAALLEAKREGGGRVKYH